MPDRCYVCKLVKPRKEHAFHCWCYHPDDKEAHYRGICEACYVEKGDKVFEYTPNDGNHRLTKIHKYGPEGEEYYKKYKLPRGGGFIVSFDGETTIYTSMDGTIYRIPPAPKCICCDHTKSNDI
jgi:hypothetical protein